MYIHVYMDYDRISIWNLVCSDRFALLKSWFYIHEYLYKLLLTVKERHETIMGYKPRERVALEWFIPIIIELLVL